MKDEPPSSAGVDPFMVASGAAGAYLGGKYAGRQMDRLTLMRLEREYGLPRGSLSAMTPSDLARLIAVPPRPAPPAVAPVTAPASTGALPTAANSPTAQSTRILQGGEGDTLGTTGRARQTGYNVETAQQAAAKKEADAAAELTRRTGATNRTASQFLADQPGLTSSPAGVLYPRVEPRPTIGPRTQYPDVWSRNRGTGPIFNLHAPHVRGAPSPVGPLPLSADPASAPPLAAAPPEAPNAPRRGSMAPLQSRAANVGTGAVAGLGGGLQAYNMASKMQQGNTPDWTEGLSLVGNLAPILSRAKILQPAGALMQLPYLYKHWREIAAGLNMGDIMPYGTSTLAEENQPVSPTPGR